MKAKWLGLLGLVAVLVGAASVRAGEQELWRYGCDAMLSGACFRLPNGMSVTYSVPADSGIYEVQQAGREVVTFYAGHAPSRSSFVGTPALVLDSRTHGLKAFVNKEEGRQRLDILISPKKKGGTFVHAFAFLDEGNVIAVASALSGLRPCNRQSIEITRCAAESLWGKELSTWIRSSGPKTTQDG